ncbi:quinone oxidoreductase [Diplodia corticola]|uniref:Quinone oxidoreductase n=1 Tax=Diplodia corticola TaxID=236234 RepID=A0A1J9RV50_9PEZI|nr:quinone oxidoreductase [Diplodia corticola]OJD31724.1 quinone oxidoreductase [Diplodia corticola]
MPATTMKQAQVSAWGQPPTCTTVPIPALPAGPSSSSSSSSSPASSTTTTSDDTMVQIRVLAAGLPTLVRSRAAGTHYSTASTPRALPHVPGVDGVGTTVPDGRLVYFSTLMVQQAAAPGGGGGGGGSSGSSGSFAEVVNVPRAATVPVPVSLPFSSSSAGVNDDDDDNNVRIRSVAVQVAGQMNAVMASWMALAARVRPVVPAAEPPAGWTAVVVGATGLAGAAAVGVAREWGAGRVVGVGRDAARLMDGGLGLDAVVVLQGGDGDGDGDGAAAHTDYGVAAEADVVLDFLYGPPALGLLRALRPKRPNGCQYVQIGTVVQRDMALPGDVLRSKDITMRGAGPGAWQMEAFAAEAPKMVEAIVAGKIRPYKFREVKLEDIEEAWGQKGGDRMVIVPQ